MEPDDSLQAQQARLTEMLRPYQREVNRQQGIADFVNRCLAAPVGMIFSALRAVEQSHGQRGRGRTWLGKRQRGL